MTQKKKVKKKENLEGWMQKKIRGMIVEDAKFMADMDKQMQKEVARTAKEDKKLEDYMRKKISQEIKRQQGR